MSDIIIRRATRDDLEVLQSISIQTFIETFSDVNTKEDIDKYVSEDLSLSKLESELNNSASIFYLAELNGKAVAFLKINFEAAQTEEGYSNSLEVQRIYVLKEYKSMGIGKLLMEQALQVAKQDQLSYIWLGVWEKNTAAIQFYEKRGFVKFGEHIFKLGNDEQTDYLMKLSL